MNKDVLEKIKEIAEQAKWQQPPWQTVPTKKSKKGIETSTSIVEKTIPIGTKTTPTGTSSLPATSPIGVIATATPSYSSAQRRPLLKPFATAVVNDWFNNTMKILDEETYTKLNGIFRSLQSNDMKTANF